LSARQHKKLSNKEREAPSICGMSATIRQVRTRTDINSKHAREHKKIIHRSANTTSRPKQTECPSELKGKACYPSPQTAAPTFRSPSPPLSEEGLVASSWSPSSGKRKWSSKPAPAKLTTSQEARQRLWESLLMAVPDRPIGEAERFAA
jgi:hypothetical protein